MEAREGMGKAKGGRAKTSLTGDKINPVKRMKLPWRSEVKNFEDFLGGKCVDFDDGFRRVCEFSLRESCLKVITFLVSYIFSLSIKGKVGPSLPFHVPKSV